MIETGRRPPHETLDAQLVRYWEREAARFDGLAARAMFGWVARGYARRAQRARAQAERARAREVARGRLPATAPAAAEPEGDSPG
ncbi:MAG: hypothetical protein PGN25_03930 [Methylorubrum populi]